MRKFIVIISFVVIFCVMISSFTGMEMVSTGDVPQMSMGSSGQDVERLQQRLKNWGYYDGNVDGNYGIETLLAIKSFQTSWGLQQTGVTDAKTLLMAGMGKQFRKNEAFAQTADEVQLLARTINGEARGEPFEGQVAVGAVILNRVKDSRFPKTIAGVIYQPLAFTAVADGQINVPIDPKSTVVKAARDALNGWDPTNGCLYYWNPATATSKWIWSRQIKKKIGKHNFGI